MLVGIFVWMFSELKELFCVLIRNWFLLFWSVCFELMCWLVFIFVLIGEMLLVFIVIGILLKGIFLFFGKLFGM